MFCLQHPMRLWEDPPPGFIGLWAAFSPQAPELRASQREEGAKSELPGKDEQPKRKSQRMRMGVEGWGALMALPLD